MDKNSEEPEEWNLEVSHANPHLHGAPGYMQCLRSKRKSTSIIFL